MFFCTFYNICNIFGLHLYFIFAAKIINIMDKVLFSSNSCEWSTLDYLFKKLNDEFQFSLDVCAPFSSMIVIFCHNA